MLTEKNVISNIVEKFISNKCISTEADEENNTKLKTYFKKDDKNCFTIIDKEHSIKCIFEDNFLREYLASQPSYTNQDQFDRKF